MTTIIALGLLLYIFLTGDDTDFAWLLFFILIFFGVPNTEPQTTKVTPKPITQQQETLTEP